MIKSKDEYFKYLKADFETNKIGDSFKNRILITWKYLRVMRRLEYIHNCKQNIIAKAYEFYLKYKLYLISVKSGLTIPINTFGKGLYIAHHGSVVINPTARFGDYCVLQNGVNVSKEVVGGNHIYLGAGCKILTSVHIQDNVIIGANAVVTKDIAESNTVYAGIPAKKISDNGFKDRKQI